jgi:hypothetical protein
MRAEACWLRSGGDINCWHNGRRGPPGAQTSPPARRPRPQSVGYSPQPRSRAGTPPGGFREWGPRSATGPAVRPARSGPARAPGPPRRHAGPRRDRGDGQPGEAGIGAAGIAIINTNDAHTYCLYRSNHDNDTTCGQPRSSSDDHPQDSLTSPRRNRMEISTPDVPAHPATGPWWPSPSDFHHRDYVLATAGGPSGGPSSSGAGCARPIRGTRPTSRASTPLSARRRPRRLTTPPTAFGSMRSPPARPHRQSAAA